MKCALEGIYRNGVVELLEDVPVHRTMKVIVVFKEDINEGYGTNGTTLSGYPTST